jgi:hypothetical protein
MVALAVIIVIGGVAITAIIKYPTVDDALKFWSALSGLVGLVTGAFVTYFFSRNTVQQAQADKVQAQRNFDAAAAGRTIAVQAAGVLAGHLDRDEFEQVRQREPAVQQTFAGP